MSWDQEPVHAQHRHQVFWEDLWLCAEHLGQRDLGASHHTQASQKKEVGGRVRGERKQLPHV